MCKAVKKEDAIYKEKEERIKESVEKLNIHMKDRKKVYSDSVLEIIDGILLEKNILHIVVKDQSVHIVCKEDVYSFPFEGRHMMCGLARAGMGNGYMRRLQWKGDNGVISVLVVRPPYVEEWIAIMSRNK